MLFPTLLNPTFNKAPLPPPYRRRDSCAGGDWPAHSQAEPRPAGIALRRSGDVMSEVEGLSHAPVGTMDILGCLHRRGKRGFPLLSVAHRSQSIVRSLGSPFPIRNMLFRILTPSLSLPASRNSSPLIGRSLSSNHGSLPGLPFRCGRRECAASLS